MITKVTRVPVTKEDLTIGFQKENQIRNVGQKDFTQINAANIKGVAYINTLTELKAIDTDTVDADSLFMVIENEDIYIYRYDRNSTASEDLVYNTILAPNDKKGRFIKISDLEASAFSEISWHGQVIQNSVSIPDNMNAWSFGPTMTIAPGQEVTIGKGSFWTIANGQVQ